MLRKLLGAGAVLAVVLAGCRGPKGACDTNEDCGQGQTCDASVNLCFVTETIDGKACSTTCSEFQACKDGSCTARFSGYAFLMPREGGAVKSGEVQLKVQLLPRTDINASPNYPASISFTVAPKSGGASATGTLARDAEGFYTGTWTAPQGTASDAFDLEVRSDALADAGKTSFRLDNDAPVFTVSVTTAQPGPNTAETTYVDPGLANAWRRDQVVTVAVTANEAMDASSVRLTVTGIGEGTQMAPLEVSDTGTGCGQAFCGQVDVDLSKPPMKAFRGSFELKVAGNDVAGNAGTGTKSINVTRWKWAFFANAGAIRASPAVGQKGTIYIATTSGTTGVALALAPDGKPVWPSPIAVGAAVGSPAVGAMVDGVERVFVGATVGTEATIYALSSVNGSAGEEKCGPISDSALEVSPAIIATTVGGKTLETAVAVANISGLNGGTLYGLRVGGAGNRCISRPESQNALFPAGVVAEGNNVYFGDDTGGVRSFSFSGPGWVEKGAWQSPTNVFTRALALADQKLVGGGGPSYGGVFTLPLTGGTPTKAPFSTEAWNPSVGRGGSVLVGLNAGTLLHAPVQDMPSAKEASGTSLAKGAPVFGQDGFVYTATASGALEVRSSDFSIYWREVVFAGTTPSSLGNVEGSLAIDCTRDPEGGAEPGRPGVLYVPSNNGRLYAFVVDSRGIDTTAPWPKYQHDPRNTGNADTKLSDFACP